MPGFSDNRDMIAVKIILINYIVNFFYERTSGVDNFDSERVCLIEEIFSCSVRADDYFFSEAFGYIVYRRHAFLGKLIDDYLVVNKFAVRHRVFSGVVISGFYRAFYAAAKTAIL